MKTFKKLGTFGVLIVFLIAPAAQASGEQLQGGGKGQQNDPYGHRARLMGSFSVQDPGTIRLAPAIRGHSQQSELQFIHSAGFIGDTFSGDPEMFNLTNRSMLSGALFLPTIATGLLLTKSGSPYNTWLVTAHKAAMIANVYVLNKTFFDAKSLGMVSNSDFVAMGAMNLCFLGTIATGAMLTMDHDRPHAVQTAHHVTPWVSIVASAAMLYLLGR